MVLQNRFFFGSKKVVDKKKNPNLKNHFSRTTFLQNFLEKWLQIKIRKRFSCLLDEGITKIWKKSVLFNQLKINKAKSYQELLNVWAPKVPLALKTGLS